MASNIVFSLADDKEEALLRAGGRAEKISWSVVENPFTWEAFKPLTGYHLSADNVLVPIGSDHETQQGENSGDQNSETAVEKRVDAVIDDLSNGRVVARKVDQLADAVTRSRVDAQVGRAINRSFTR
jgi:hypothetical protein